MTLSHKNAVNEYLVQTNVFGLDILNTKRVAQLQTEIQRLKIHIYYLEQNTSAKLKQAIKESKQVALNNLLNPEEADHTDTIINFKKQLSEKKIDDEDIQIINALNAIK